VDSKPTKPAAADERKGILGHISSPLVFFALALLVIESGIGAAAALAGLASSHFVYVVLIMAFLFLADIGAVTWMAIRWPQQLIAEHKEDLRRSVNMVDFVNSEAFANYLEDKIARSVRGDCLRPEVRLTAGGDHERKA